MLLRSEQRLKEKKVELNKFNTSLMIGYIPLRTITFEVTQKISYYDNR
jgi:hypothetical protein